MVKTKKPKIPKGYEGGEVVYELTTKQTFWPKMGKEKPAKGKKIKVKPMEVKVTNVVKTTTKGGKRKKK